MRLIDADELRLHLEKRMAYESHRNHAYLKGLRDVIKDIDMSKTAEVETVKAEPIRHGRWIENDEYRLNNVLTLECSICGHGMWHSRYGEETPKYCCNCGAKMDNPNAHNALQHVKSVESALKDNEAEK